MKYRATIKISLKNVFAAPKMHKSINNETKRFLTYFEPFRVSNVTLFFSMNTFLVTMLKKVRAISTFGGGGEGQN